MDNAKIMAEDKGDYAIAFTQTYNTKLLMHKNPTHLRQFRESWNDIEYELSKCGNAYAVPEFTLNGIIHYHGMIEVKDKYEYQKMIYRMKKKYGYNLFKAIDNRPKWEAYVLKDKRENEKLCRLPEGSLPLIIKHNKSNHKDIRKIDELIRLEEDDEEDIQCVVKKIKEIKRDVTVPIHMLGEVIGTATYRSMNDAMTKK